MMIIRSPLSLSHQKLIEPQIRALEIPLSEYTFASLYLFRKLHEYELIEGKQRYIAGKTADKKIYLMPLNSPETWDWEEIKTIYDKSDFFFPIPEEWALYFNKEQFLEDSLDSESDYIYQVESFIDYQGNGLSKRRNLVHQFIDQHPNYYIEVLEEGKMHLATQVLNYWINEGDRDKNESDACQEAIELLGPLGLSGISLYVDPQTPVAFLIGEPLTSNTFVIHFSKGISTYKGAYQVLFQEFAKSVGKRWEFFNMEQDLGIPSLRQSKKAYHPHHMGRKLRIANVKSIWSACDSSPLSTHRLVDAPKARQAEP